MMEPFKEPPTDRSARSSAPLLPRAYQIGIVILLNCVLFLPSLGYDFTGLDDTQIIVQKADYLKRLSTITDAFGHDTSFEPGVLQEAASIYYRPLETLSYMWDAAIGGQRPFIYHLTNLILHIVNSLLVLSLLNSMAVSPLLSLWGASVFAVHPLLAQAVAWIPGRIDLLPALFVLSSMLFFIRYLRMLRVKDLLLHALFFMLGLFSKETAIVTPLMAFAYYWVDARDQSPRLRWTPIGALYGIVLAIWYVMRARALAHSAADLSALSLMKSFVHNFPIYFKTLQKLILPFHLSPVSTPQDTYYGLFLLALLILILLFYFSSHVSWTRAAFGFLWFNVFLLPTFVVPIMTGFENRTYLPMVGFLIMVLETDLLKRLSLRRSYGLYAGAAFLVFLLILNVSHVRSFKNGYEFWKKAAENSPHSSLAKLNYGARLVDQGRLDEAFEVYTEGLRLNPGEPKLHNNIGVIFARARKLDLAEQEFKKEIQINPGYGDVYFNLGVLYGEKQDWPRMEQMWRKALDLDPRNERAKKLLDEYHRRIRGIE